MCWCQNRIHTPARWAVSIAQKFVCCPHREPPSLVCQTCPRKCFRAAFCSICWRVEKSYSSPCSSNLSDDGQETSASRSLYTFLEYACIEHETTGEATLKRFSVMDSESRVTGNSKNIPIKGHNPEDDHDYTIDNSIEPPRKFFRDIPRIPYDGNCLRLVRPLSD